MTSVTVSPSNVILYPTETQQFTVACHYSDHGDDDCTLAGTVNWNVTDSRMGSITPTGFYSATASAAGANIGYIEAHVGATWGFAYLAQTAATGNTVTSISYIMPVSGDTVVVGSTLWASAKVMLSTGSSYAWAREVVWTSSNPSVATIDWEGHITALSAGSTTLTATARGQTKTTVLNVISAPTGPFNTWYVRPGGGTRYDAADNPTGQCDGLHDADYPGSGINQPCALASWKWLWNTGPRRVWIISGGDTVIIRQNPTGAGNNNTDWSSFPGGSYDPGYDSGYSSFGTVGQTYATCGGAGSSGCANPPIPRGSPANPTKIYGENWAACSAISAKTQIYGTYNVGIVLTLDNTSNVDIRCLGVSDRSHCMTGGPTNICVAGTDSYGKSGISVSSSTTNLSLTDVDIHGMAANGLVGMPGDGLTLTRVRAAGNHTAGFNMDPGGSYVQGGGMLGSHLLLEWNGCSEEYPVVDTLPYYYCTDQNNAGYGDAIGTADTGGRWQITDSTFRYNTQDGLDLLHVDYPGATFTVERSKSYGNMGQQFKLGMVSQSIFRNNFIGDYCYRLSAPMAGTPTGYNAYLTDFCRANGTAVLVTSTTHSRYYIDGNTWIGNSNIALETECGGSYGGQTTGNCASTDGGGIYFRDNIIRGYRKGYGQDAVTTAFYLGNGANLGTVFPERRNNLIDHIKVGLGADCPTGYTGELCTEPLFSSYPSDTAWEAAFDQTLWDGVDPHLTSASPAVGAGGTTVSGLTVDNEMFTRLAPTAMGAFEYGSSASTPPAISTAELPTGVVGTAYSQTLSATGDAPIAWSVVSGSLPSWASLNVTTGAITGTPNAAGTTSFTVRATNSAGTSDKTLSIKVTAPRTIVTGKASITGHFSLLQQ